MFFRLLFCVVVVSITASAQPRNFTPVPDNTSPVAVAVSPDGHTVAVARGSSGAAKRYGRVELWNAQSGELQRTISGFDGPVWSLTFSRDGGSLFTVSTEYRESKIQSSVRDREEKVFGELKWWNTQTGEFIRKISVGGEGVRSMEATWSPGGDLLALVERRTERQLTELSEMGVMNQRRIIPGFVNQEETELKLLDAQTGQRKVKLEDASKSQRGYLARVFGRLERPVFSSDGTRVAALTGEDASIWDVATGKKIVTLKKLDGWPTAIAFSEDGRTLAVASTKGRMPGGESEISLWDAATGKSLNKLKGKNDSIACLQFAAEDRALLIGSLQYEPQGAVGTVKMWGLRENRLGNFDVHADQAVSSLTLIPSEGAVVLQSGSDVELRDAKTFQIRYAFEPTEADESESMRRSRFLLTASRALAVAFSADGTTVSAEIPGEGIRVWDVRTGELKNHIPRPESSSEGSTTSANGGLIAEANTQDQNGRVQVRDANTRTVIRRIEAGQKITAVAIDATGHLLAAAREDHSIALWNLKTGALQGEFRKHQDTINALAFSLDGQTLASGGDDRTAILWDIASGKPKRTLKGHDVTVTSLAFSPDGQTLASGSGNAAVVLWNVATGKLDRVLR
ncbi:MAG TPA: WD40 repeat domain-containing protein [Pyrinomonadaceae bacterium]|nr:WD40 repeat domain-containing protein [Pyrinomonadaceae bacterium]